MKIEPIEEKKINKDIFWLRVSIIALGVSICLGFIMVAQLEKRIKVLEAPAVNPYKTQVLFKI